MYCFQACPSESCNKKVIDQSNGTYRCEKCQKEFPNYKWRIILSVCKQRARGSYYLLIFVHFIPFDVYGSIRIGYSWEMKIWIYNNNSIIDYSSK